MIRACKLRKRGSRYAFGEIACEERLDAASRISRVVVFVTRSYRSTEHPDQALMVVEEGMPSVGVLFDIMVDLTPRESAFQPRGRALQCPVATAKARDHWTGTIQDRIDVVRDPAVFRRYCQIAVAGRQQDRKTACRAEAGDADLARVILSILQPLLSRLSRNLLVLTDVHGEAVRWRAGPAICGSERVELPLHQVFDAELALPERASKLNGPAPK
jgi:hypothetical protein